MRYPFFLLVCIFLLQAGCGGDEKPKSGPEKSKPAVKEVALPPIKNKLLEGPSDSETRLAINLAKINTVDVRELRDKLKSFISHKFFLPDEAGVKTQKNSLRIVSMLDKPSDDPRPSDIRLTNFEVEKFLLVLKTLDDLSIKEIGKSHPSGKD